MKKTVPIVLVILLVAGLAFYMGRQSATAPVVENPPAESSGSEVKETSQSESTPEVESIPEPAPAVTVSTSTDIGGVPKSIFDEFCEKAFRVVWSSERLLEGDGNHLETELARLKGYLEDIGRAMQDVHATQYQLWREENHPDPKPDFLFAPAETDVFFSSAVKVIYDIPCLFHAVEKEINAQTFHNKKASDAMISEGGKWVRFKYNGIHYYLPAELCNLSSETTTSNDTAVIDNTSNVVDEQKPTSNPPESKPESTGPDPNTGNSNTQDSTNIPENPEGATQLTWEDLVDSTPLEGGPENGGNSDKPIDNSHLIEHGSGSGGQDSTNIPENPEGYEEIDWESGSVMSPEDMDGGNSDKPIDNSHLTNNGG